MNEKRYRAAEARLFDDAGIQPRERWVDLGWVGSRTRVLEVGDGEPVVFLHGGPMAAATWSYVAAGLEGIRAVMVDRPGCGLSEPPSQIPTAQTVGRYVESVTEDVLDQLELAQATLVGSSFGGYSAIRSAAALPSRIRGVFLAGCPPFVPGWTQIPFFTLLRAPVLGKLMVRLPATSTSVRLGLRQMGHRQALRDNKIPAPMLDWERAWQRDTHTLRNDAQMIRQCGTFTGGFHTDLDLGPDELDQVKAPVVVMVGTSDPIGGADVGRHLADLLPDATVEIWDGAGHLPWLDDPARLARSVQAFALRQRTADH